MALRKIITTENPILRQKAKKVHRFDPSLQKLVNDMFETMQEANGVGLAAPQIALSIRVFVAEYEDRKVAIFNPEIIKAEGEEFWDRGLPEYSRLCGRKHSPCHEDHRQRSGCAWQEYTCDRRRLVRTHHAARD